jgi:hypothetical protein
MGVLTGIFVLWLCCKLFISVSRFAFNLLGSVFSGLKRIATDRRRKRKINKQVENVNACLNRVQTELKKPVQYHITVNGADVPIKNGLQLSNKEFIEQEKRIAIVEKAAREKERFEWQREKMEWARQREAERKAEAERKRAEREQAAQEKAAREADEKQLKKRLADRDAIHSAEMVNDLYGAMYAEIEQLKKGATAPKEKVRLLNSQAALLNRIHREQQNIEKAKYIKYRCGV